jgi:hypothetical protein
MYRIYHGQTKFFIKIIAAYSLVAAFDPAREPAIARDLQLGNPTTLQPQTLVLTPPGGGRP